MRRPELPLFITVCVILFAAISCQSNPTSPEINQTSLPSMNRNISESGTHYNLGNYLLSINSETLDVSVIPLRSADLHMNLTGIMNSTMGLSVAGVPSESQPSTGYIVLDITIHHPFATKQQFSGFDVKGILIAPGTLNVGSLIFSDTDETRLENADGYTRWWNPTEFTTPGVLGYIQGNFANAGVSKLTSTVNPYKLFADRLGNTDGLSWIENEPMDTDLGRAVFRAGSNNTRRYQIQFPMDPGPKIVYGYAIDCSWAPPNPNPPTQVPDDFPINANQPEAWRVTLNPTLNSLYFDPESGIGGGTAKFQVNVSDWQGMETGNIDAEVSAVRIFAPELMPDGVDGIFLNETSTKARYTADLTGTAEPIAPGEVIVACRVGSEGGPEYNQGFGAAAPSGDVSAWQTAILDVADPDCTADVNNDFSEAFPLDLENPTISQLCGTADYKDYYGVSFPLSHDISGNLTLYCTPTPTKFSLYDSNEMKLKEVIVSGETAVLDLDALGIMPGDYYIEILTQTTGQAFLYAIEPNITLQDVTPNAVEVTPGNLYYSPRFVSSHENTVYASTQNGLWIFDYTDSCINPTFLSYTRIETEPLLEPALSYPYIYSQRDVYPSEYGIDVLDVSDPSNPVLYAIAATVPYDGYCMVAEPDYLYIAVFQNPDAYILIYDLSTPTDPEYLTEFTLGPTGPGIPRKLGLVRDQAGPDYWLVVEEGENYIEYYNVTDKMNIPAPYVYMWAPGASTQDFAVVDNMVYILTDNGAGTEKLEVFQMTAFGPIFQDSAILDEQHEFVDVEGDIAYMATKDGEQISWVNISDPSNLSDPDAAGAGHIAWMDMEADGEDIYLTALDAGLMTMSISNPESPANCGYEYGLGITSDMYIQDDILYVAAGTGNYNSIVTVDISDPADAKVEGNLELDGFPYFVRVAGDKMVATYSGDKIIAIDCTNPENLIEVNLKTPSNMITSIGMTDVALYVGTMGGNFEVWNLAYWPVIGNAGFQPVTSGPEYFTFYENVMYVLINGDILVYSIADPLNPSYITTYVPLGPAQQITIEGDYLYIATGGTLEIASLENPLAPVYVASEVHPDSPNGEFVAVENQFAMLQPLMTKPPTVMRIWPPDDPEVTGILYGDDFQSFIYGALIYNGYYYERDSGYGIRIWDLY